MTSILQGTDEGGCGIVAEVPFEVKSQKLGRPVLSTTILLAKRTLFSDSVGEG
jgi:hypothetical protein